MTIPKTVLAYLAGLFDGEGSISIGNRSPSFSLRIRITNTNLEVLEWVTELYGGNIRRKNRVRPHHKACWEWILRDRKAAQALTQFYPFMIVKKPQAQLVVGCWKTVLARSGRYWTKELRQQVSAVKKQLEQMNRGGHGLERNTDKPDRKTCQKRKANVRTRKS